MEKISSLILGKGGVELNREQIDILLSGLEQKANYYVKQMGVPDNSWLSLKQNALELYKIADLAEKLEGQNAH